MDTCRTSVVGNYVDNKVKKKKLFLLPYYNAWCLKTVQRLVPKTVASMNILLKISLVIASSALSLSFGLTATRANSKSANSYDILFSSAASVMHANTCLCIVFDDI